MSKSILVIDTPNACIDCPCHFAEYYDKSEYCCVVENGLLTDNIETFKPDWCPLREIPKKKRTVGKLEENDKLCMNFGYNACIDEILTEGEE